ncbi:MAG: PulJ/GspJ family protein [bacterium]
MGSFLKHFTADRVSERIEFGRERYGCAFMPEECIMCGGRCSLRRGISVNSAHKTGGFTLLEVLIAMFLFAIMISFVYFTFISTNKGRVYSLRSARPYIVSQTVFRILHNKLISFNYLYPVFIATVKKTNGQKLPGIYFSGLANTPVPFFKKESIPSLNYFYLKRMKTEGGGESKYYELAYKESYFKSGRDGSVKTGFKKIIIAKNIVFLSVKYFLNNIWTDKYNYSSYNAAPKAIKIKLGIAIASKGGGSSDNGVKVFRYMFNM